MKSGIYKAGLLGSPDHGFSGECRMRVGGWSGALPGSLKTTFASSVLSIKVSSHFAPSFDFLLKDKGIECFSWAPYFQQPPLLPHPVQASWGSRNHLEGEPGEGLEVGRGLKVGSEHKV